MRAILETRHVVIGKTKGGYFARIADDVSRTYLAHQCATFTEAYATAKEWIESYGNSEYAIRVISIK